MAREKTAVIIPELNGTGKYQNMVHGFPGRRMVFTES
jgi:hypothetical protein